MSNPASAHKVAVIGAGITGLCAALALRERGHSVTLYEASSDAGGVIRSREVDGYTLEQGPHTLLVRNQATRDLLARLDLEPSVQQSNPTAERRFVLRDGRLVDVPTSIKALLTTELLSARARLRLLAEPFAGSADPEIDESLALFIARRLGEEVLDYAINPFVAGTFAGDPRHLSARFAFPRLAALEDAAGSLLAGLIQRARHARRSSLVKQPSRLIGFKGGNAALVHALEAELGDSLHLDHPISSLRRSQGHWHVGLRDPEDQPKNDIFDAVVCCIPTTNLSKLDIRQSDRAHDLSIFDEVVHPPVSVVALGFDRAHVKHPLDGFGMLIPAVEHRNILGTLFMSTLFEHRAPEGKVLLSTFVGGARQPQLAELEDDALVDVVVHELRDILGVTRPPEMIDITRWRRSIPQYEVGYARYIQQIESVEATHPGLYLAGNFRHGIAVPDLIEAAFETAASVDDFLAWQHTKPAPSPT